MIDTHAHLTSHKLSATDVIANMSKDGLDAIITVGYDTKTSKKAVSLANANDNIYAAIGIHPTEFTSENSLDGILPLADNKKVVAYGEIGLDYHWDMPDRATQKLWFERQLDAAISLHLPIIIHSRDCDGDMLPILKSWASKIKDGLVMHCFSSSKEVAREYIKLGFYISFAGPITYKNAHRGDVIREVPAELLLAETDCPYLAPQAHRGQTNQPAYVRYVVEKLAHERGTSFEEMDKLTTANAQRFYRL